MCFQQLWTFNYRLATATKESSKTLNVFFPITQQPSGAWPPQFDVFLTTFSNTHTTVVGLFRTRDRPVAETSTWQHTTVTTDRLPSLCGNQTHHTSKRTAAVIDTKLSTDTHSFSGNGTELRWFDSLTCRRFLTVCKGKVTWCDSILTPHTAHNDNVLDRRRSGSSRPTFQPAITPHLYPKYEYVSTGRNKNLNISRVYSSCTVTTLDVSYAVDTFLAPRRTTFQLIYPWTTIIVMLKCRDLVYDGNHVNQIKYFKPLRP